MQKVFKNRLAMISGITGLFLLFVSFFLGSGPAQLFNATSHRFAISVQPLVIALASIAIGVYIVSVIINYKELEVKISAILALVVFALLFILCIYFVIAHLTVKNDGAFRTLTNVKSSNFYGACVLIKYLLTFISLPTIGMMMLFVNRNSNKKTTEFAKLANKICVGVCAAFLIMAAITCLPDINNSLITLSRFNGSSSAAPVNSVIYMTHYNVNGMSLQQLNMIQKMITGSIARGSELISVAQMRYAMTLLVSYAVMIVTTIACVSINLVMDFKHGGIVDDK